MNGSSLLGRVTTGAGRPSDNSALRTVRGWTPKCLAMTYGFHDSTRYSRRIWARSAGLIMAASEVCLCADR